MYEEHEEFRPIATVLCYAQAEVFRHPEETHEQPIGLSFRETRRTAVINNNLQPEANHGHNSYTSYAFHRNRTKAVILKSIQLFLSTLILWTVSDHVELLLDRSTGFIFATLGAFIVLPILAMAGLIVGEISSKLMVWLNCTGAVLFSIVAALLFCDDRFVSGTSIFWSIIAVILYATDAYIASKTLPFTGVRRRFVRHTHAD